MNAIRQFFRKPFFIRLLHWEYWPFNVVYAPILPVYACIAARCRSLLFFNAANPGIRYGGFLMESKNEIYQLMPNGSYPSTLYFPAGTAPEQVLTVVQEAGLSYPLIAKPDVGARGQGVRKLNGEADLRQYCIDSPLDFLVQAFVPYPLEAGIFYYRMPGEEKGRISGIVSKHFPSVKGDGKSSLRALAAAEERYILQLPDLEKILGPALDRVPAKGEEVELLPFGNHARGALFLDHSHLADEALTEVIDRLCRQVEGFYYGRLDIRFRSWEGLREGRDFSVIELNASGSEPTHIYDPAHSIFFGWKEIIRHWRILARISRANHRRGIPYLSWQEGRRMFREQAAFEKKIRTIHV